MIATTSAAPVKRIPSARTPCSFFRGTSAITKAPTRGRNVAIEIAEFSHVIVPNPLRSS
jgi:hypothetical protein